MKICYYGKFNIDSKLQILQEKGELFSENLKQEIENRKQELQEQVNKIEQEKQEQEQWAKYSYDNEKMKCCGKKRIQCACKKLEKYFDN